MKILRTLPLLCLLAVPFGADAQKPVPAAEQQALTETVTALDSKLFDAYNHCDLATLGAMVADDLEFYHDQTGLMVGRDAFVAAIKENICGKVERTLVPGSLEVYPLKGYGAVEIGVHRFHHLGHPEDVGGEAKFVTLWQNKDGVWKVTRVISYNHESLTK
jgi:ketosteroid isomerase-like protein